MYHFSPLLIIPASDGILIHLIFSPFKGLQESANYEKQARSLHAFAHFVLSVIIIPYLVTFSLFTLKSRILFTLYYRKFRKLLFLHQCQKHINLEKEGKKEQLAEGSNYVEMLANFFICLGLISFFRMLILTPRATFISHLQVLNLQFTFCLAGF